MIKQENYIQKVKFNVFFLVHELYEKLKKWSKDVGAQDMPRR